MFEYSFISFSWHILTASLFCVITPWVLDFLYFLYIFCQILCHIITVYRHPKEKPNVSSEGKYYTTQYCLHGFWIIKVVGISFIVSLSLHIVYV